MLGTGDRVALCWIVNFIIGNKLMPAYIYNILIISMVYVPRISFKSGINPTKLATFPLNGKYTGTQKLLLSRTRIFGDKISGTYPSGMKVWHKPQIGRCQFLDYKSVQMYDVDMSIQGLRDRDNQYVRLTMLAAIKAKRQVKDAKKAAKEANKKKK